MKRKTKVRTAMLRVAPYGGTPVNGMAARVAGMRPAASKIQGLRRRAKKARNVEKKTALMTDVCAIERRLDSRLVSFTAIERARESARVIEVEQRSAGIGAHWFSDEKPKTVRTKIIVGGLLIAALTACSDLELSRPQEVLVADCLELAEEGQGSPTCLEVTAEMEHAFLKSHPKFYENLKAERETAAAAQADRDREYNERMQKLRAESEARVAESARERERVRQEEEKAREARQRQQKVEARALSLANCGKYALEGAERCSGYDIHCNARVKANQQFAGFECKQFSESEIKAAVDRARAERARTEAEQQRARAAAAAAIAE